MIISIHGDLLIQTGQEQAGDSHRTTVFDRSTGTYLLHWHESTPAWSAAEAQAQHDRYVQQFAPRGWTYDAAEDRAIIEMNQRNRPTGPSRTNATREQRHDW